MDIFSLSQESLWLITVVYDLGLALLLYRFFGKYGLYVAVVLGIVLGNLQGGKVSELIIFGSPFKVSMGAILYSGIYFATDLISEKYGRREANTAVILGAILGPVFYFISPEWCIPVSYTHLTLPTSDLV